MYVIIIMFKCSVDGGDEVSRVRTDIISPRRQFVLTEGEIFHDM